MKTRALLTIVISLITGFILGFLVSSQITRLRTRDVRSISSKESIKMRTYDLINPTEEQKESIDPIILRFSERMDSMRKVTHSGFKALIDEYHKSLEPYLSEEQMDILNDFARAIRNKKHFHKDDHHHKDQHSIKDDRHSKDRYNPDMKDND